MQQVFPPPPSTRPADEIRPQRYPSTSFASPNRKRPEPLQLKEKESDPSEDSRNANPEIDDENESPKNRNAVFLKSAPGAKAFPPEFPRKGVQEFEPQPTQRLPNLNRQLQQSPNRISQDLDKPAKDFTRPTSDPFSRRPSPDSLNRGPSRTELNNPDQDLKSASQEHPDYAYPLRYSLEQVPTASLRYHNS